MSVIINRKNKTAVVHVTANTTLTIAGTANTSAIALTGETITGATIKQVFFGSDTGTWTIKRGANTVAVLSGTQHMDYAGLGLALIQDSTATLVITLSGGTGYCMIELAKEMDPATVSSQYY